MKKIKIIATVGPACQTAKRLKSLILAGVDVFRINMSHQTPESLRAWCRLIRNQKSRYPNRNPLIMVDLQGPRMRTGRLKGKNLKLSEKQKITIRTGETKGNGKIITTPFRPLAAMVKPGSAIFIDNGLLELRVLKVRQRAGEIDCQVVTGGKLGENKGINVPYAVYPSSALTEKDSEDLRAAARLNVDWIALSFVRSAEDLKRLKHELEKFKKKIPVMAKIEKAEALNHLVDILESCDGVMVARGDLGIEMGVEQVPILQKRIIRHANRKGVFVVTATEMLESMIEQPRPTRAEASDVANAILDGTDAVMLSGETAVGKHPLRAIQFMTQIIRATQKYQKVMK